MCTAMSVSGMPVPQLLDVGSRKSLCAFTFGAIRRKPKFLR